MTDQATLDFTAAPTSPAPFTTEDEFNTAVATIQTAAAAYYDGEGTQTMTDAEYDDLLDRVQASVDANPDWDDQGVTTDVAAGQSAGGDVRHTVRMLSLDKVAGPTRDDDLTREVRRMTSNGATMGFTVEPKLDGMAVSVSYVNGQRTTVATRGDGSTGENLTDRADKITINGLPATLPTSDTFEVRGELYMSDDDFTVSNANRVAAGKGAFANPRNATAGSLRSDSRTYDVALSFAAYDIVLPAGQTPDTDSASRNLTALAARNNIATAVGLFAGCATIQQNESTVAAQVAALGDSRTSLGFPIDGAVIKVDDLTDRGRLGVGSRTPKWAVAYKYPPLDAATVLRNIVPTIGRTGRLALTAIIDPVTVDGSTVAKASVHNADWVVAAGLALGQAVTVHKANDIIPQITAPAGSADGLDLWEPPATCPQCDGDWDKSSVLWRCHNPECSIAGRLNYAMQRDCLDVDGFGTAIAEALAESGQAKNIADLYDLTEDDYANLVIGSDGSILGAANAAKIIAGLEASKSQPLNRVITALGIRMTGRSVGRWLATHFQSMDALRAATVDEIAQIEKLGPVKAQHIVDGLVAMGPVIDRLAAHGLTMEVVDDGGDKPLEGGTYVISGSVPGYSRTEAQERIVALGGKASSSVSKNTTALVTAETGTSKAKKAAELGVPVIDPDEFAKILAG